MRHHENRRRGRTRATAAAWRGGRNERTGGSPQLRLALALGLALCAALVVSSLRLEIFRLRYALAEGLREEEGLIERRNALEVEVARLRDPRRLHRLAAERGFGLPERVIRLDEPGPDVASQAIAGEERP